MHRGNVSAAQKDRNVILGEKGQTERFPCPHCVRHFTQATNTAKQKRAGAQNFIAESQQHCNSLASILTYYLVTAMVSQEVVKYYRLGSAFSEAQ